MTVTATDVQQSTVYHSPQTPGYTCWVSTWLMPDGALRVSFHQATGPLTGRPMAPRSVQEALGWPPANHSVGYDMTGTIQQLITLESRDAGQTWTQLWSEPFHTPMNGVYSGYAVLPDGTILRTVWGMYLPFYDVPQTGHVQRSEDGGRTWSGPILLMDERRALTLPKRVRVLRDGRILVVGGLIRLTDEVRTFRQGLAHIEAALWLSGDGGKSWSEPVVVMTAADGAAPTEESDVAELPDGRLLLVNRTNVPDRRQAVLRPVGDTYAVESRGMAPFPHSGMPDVLWAREGVALHIATSNVSWTADAGATWADLDLHTSYYPSSVQLPDGRIFCVGHRGSDDPYDGTVDQQIEALAFRLKVD
ncbi:MAG: exo-alpha-sialidase [Armatimonadetes bacterium]|nr:exo-alpha-sialidase [Armatimonadota bacterium]